MREHLMMAVCRPLPLCCPLRKDGYSYEDPFTSFLSFPWFRGSEGRARLSNRFSVNEGSPPSLNGFSYTPHHDSVETGGRRKAGLGSRSERNEDPNAGMGKKASQNWPCMLATWQPSELEHVELGTEKELRFFFLESLLGRAREGDVVGAEEAMADMHAVGLKCGPRAYHGLVAAYTLSGNTEGALQALRRELNAGQQPLPETFVALLRSFATKGQRDRGEEILSAMEHYKLNCHPAWLVFIEELLKAGYYKEANGVFLRRAKVGWKATDAIYDRLVQANAEALDHAGVIATLRYMEYMGRMAKTYHYNCLLMVEAIAGEADIAAQRFEYMQYGRDDIKPDVESYNWLFQAHTRCKDRADRCQAVIDVLGHMVEDYRHVQPNAKTYALLVECFAKNKLVNEAVRHFRALSKLPGAMQLLHNNGNDGDPLSVFLRALCLTGRIDDLSEALERMSQEEWPIPPRAMIVNRKGRTLVSSWIEPLQEEADLGYEVDYIARYIAEGGLSGTRRRWSPSEDGKSSPIDPDTEGFAFGAPMEVSYKRYCSKLRRDYASRLIKKLRREGVSALGPDATEADYNTVIERLRRATIVEPQKNFRKPKAASKMLVSELKEELAAQGLPYDGTRPVLYQRVQKARRINRARGRPLWVPPEQQEEEVDDGINKFISRLNLENENNTDYWRQRLVEAMEKVGKDREVLFDTCSSNGPVEADKTMDEDDGLEETLDDLEDVDEDDEPEPPTSLAMQLFQDSPVKLETQDNTGNWLNLSLEEKLMRLKEDKRFDVSEMYTITDAWGWTWENELDAREPEKWSQEREVNLGLQIMHKVICLGGIPTIGDCAMLLRAAIRTPWPEAIVKILQQAHKLGYAFGIALYDEVVSLCMRLDERDAAIAIVTDMEDADISATDVILDKILPDETEI